MKYTSEELLTDYNKFRVFRKATELLENAIGLVGSPRRYTRHIDYIYDILVESSPNLTREFIIDICEAIDESSYNRMHYHYDNKIPFDEDFDVEQDDFKNVCEKLSGKYLS